MTKTECRNLALKMRKVARELRLRKTALLRGPEKLDSQKVLDFLRFFGGYNAK